jgi:hypothetical protein
VDVLPGDRGQVPQSLERLAIAGGAISLQQGREQDRVVGDDDVGGQPAALVGDGDIEIGVSDQLLFTTYLGDLKVAPPTVEFPGHRTAVA